MANNFARKTTIKKSSPKRSSGSKTTYSNGKFYNTAFRKPVELSKTRVKQLHRMYDPCGVLTDRQVVSLYSADCRKEFGPLYK